MFSFLVKIFNQYKLLVEKVFTFIGCLVVYLFGISLSFIFRRLFFSRTPKNCWQKIDQKINPEVMY